MIRLARRRIAGARHEEGVALVMVIGIGAVLVLIVTLCMSLSVSGLVRSQRDQDWAAAMSAAYAGVADYQGRVTNNPSYSQYGNPSAPFTIANGSSGTVAMPPASQPNAAFNITAGAAWASVPSASGGAAVASFRYEVDNSKYASNGILRVRSTGRVGSVTRSVVANIKQAGFTNYVYFTDYEILDPAVNTRTCTIAYAWQSSTPRNSNCIINFVSGDTLDGQVHSNDTINICGGTFGKQVTTSNPNRVSGLLYTQTNCSPATTPTFSAGPMQYSTPIAMPAPMQQLDQTRTDIPATVPTPGCLYTGPTTITFYVSGTNAMMNVVSPWTKKTQIVGNPATGGSTPAFCGTPGNPAKTQTQNAGTLSGAAGQNIAIGSGSQLFNNLVYVQSVPTAAIDPNTWSTSSAPNKLSNRAFCKGADGSSSGNGIGFPISNESVPATAGYGCRSGDAFVQGAMHGAMTINADHFIFVTGKLAYTDPAHDILGLVGTSSVWVWNPVDSWGSNLNTFESGTCGRTINAAILSNQHSFEVQNFDQGWYLGNLCVTGSIAQEFRGPVGTGNGYTGFTKVYNYDGRLMNTPPPKFPTPRTSSYDVSTQVEVASAFAASGAPS